MAETAEARTIHPDFSNAYLERALHLPQGTFDEALGNDPALDQLAQIIRTFPWMVDVADNNFDPIYAKQKLIAVGAAKAIDELERLRPPAPKKEPEPCRHPRMQGSSCPQCGLD